MIQKIVDRASSFARDASEEEAVANLAAGYQVMLRTAQIAKDEGDDRSAARFRRKARRYLVALRAAASGADAIEVYARATGSRPWERQ